MKNRSYANNGILIEKNCMKPNCVEEVLMTTACAFLKASRIDGDFLPEGFMKRIAIVRENAF